jgi:hypothetical protein
MCCLSFGLMVGLLERDKMVNALCSVIVLVVFVVMLVLLQRFLDTIFQSFVLVLSFNPPHHHSLSSSEYPSNLAVNLLRGLNLTSNSLHTILGRQPLYFLFQKHLSLGTLGCGWCWLNFLQWGQSFFFLFFSLVLVESSASFALQSLWLHRVLWLYVLVLKSSVVAPYAVL